MNTLDPNIFKDNMQALKEFRPELYLLMETVRPTKYTLVQYPGCVPNVLIGEHPYYVGDLGKSFEDQFSKLKIVGNKQPVFLGVGLGYEVIYFIQKMALKERISSLFIIEADPEMFLCAMNVTNFIELIKNLRVKMIVGVPLEELYLKFRDYFQMHMEDLLLCGATRPVYLEGSMRYNFGYYKQALAIFYEGVGGALLNYGNCPEDSLIGLENMLDNVSEIINNPGINLLYEKFKGKPAVIIATGPSLKKNMHLLKGLEDKALLLSVDASFKLLMKNGIRPHMVTSLEREHDVQQFFDNFEPEEVKDVYMSACPVLFNHVYESYTGPKIIVYRNFDHFKWIGIERGILDIKLSSSNMAYKVADALGCDPIIYIGQDLAYGENGETHATEVPFSSEGEGMMNVPGNLGGVVKTNTGWYGFLKACEMDVASHKGRTINSTEGGAFIQGTAVMPFQTVIDRMIQDEFDPLGIIKEGLKGFGSSESDKVKLLDLITRTESDVQKIIDLCIQGVYRCKKYESELHGKVKNNRIKMLHMKILEPRTKIQAEYGETFQKFLMHVLQSYHLKFEIECIMNNMEQTEYLREVVKWYAMIGDISEICLESLKKAKIKIKS